MEHDAGGVDDAAERGGVERGESLRDQVFHRGVRCGGAAKVVEDTAGFGDDERARELGEHGREAFHHFVDGRQIAQRSGHDFDSSSLVEWSGVRESNPSKSAWKAGPRLKIKNMASMASIPDHQKPPKKRYFPFFVA